jgi:hypothetical protein
MARPIVIKECFETEVRENEKTLAELNLMLADTSKIRRGAEKIYQTSVGYFAMSLLSPLDMDGLGTLSTATGRDFVKIYNDLKQTTREAERDYTALEVTAGSESAISKKLVTLFTDIDMTGTNITLAGYAIRSMERSLARIDEFNNQYSDSKKPLLDAGGIGYFGSKTGLSHFFKKLFDRHYRIGSRLVKEFGQAENKNDPKTAIVQMQAALKAERKKVPELMNLQQEMKAEERVLKSNHQKLVQLAGKMVSDDVVAERVANEIIVALDNPDTFNAAVRALPNAFDDYIVESRAKADALTKFEAETQDKIDALKTASKGLEKHLPKLRKAGSSNKDIQIDLIAIRKAMNAQRAMARHSASETKRAGEKIRDFAHRSVEATAYVAANALDIYTQFLIIDMISDSFAGPDAHAVNAVLGIPADIATGAGIDLGKLMPDFRHDMSGLTESIKDTFNGVSFDTDAFGTLDKFEMPDIDTSSIFDSLSDGLSRMGDSLSDFGSSIGDSLGGMDFD